MFILPYVRTAGLVVILFLILALLSRMSASEVQLDVSVQHGLKKLVTKSTESHNKASQAKHPVHRLVYLTQALNYLDSATALASTKHCENVTKCPVTQLVQQLEQEQEHTAAELAQYITPVQAFQ